MKPRCMSLDLPELRSHACAFVSVRRPPPARLHCFRAHAACYFTAMRKLRILPCAYSWDVGNGLHRHGQQHHRGCRQKSQAGEATCDAIANHVAQRCTWDHASEGAHIVHFKGKNKPWKHVPPPCRSVIHGQLTTADMAAGVASSPISSGLVVATSGLASTSNPAITLTPAFTSSTPRSAPRRRLLVPGADKLLYHAGTCRLRTSLGDIGIGPPVYWSSGEPVNASVCCDEWTLLRAEWWQVARLVRSWPAAEAVEPSVFAEDQPLGPPRPSGPCVNATERCVNASTGMQAATAVGGVVCVAASCGTPEGGSMQGCSSRPGGRERCCAGYIQRHAETCCTADESGCVLKEAQLGRW